MGWTQTIPQWMYCIALLPNTRNANNGDNMNNKAMQTTKEMKEEEEDYFNLECLIWNISSVAIIPIMHQCHQIISDFVRPQNP